MRKFVPIGDETRDHPMKPLTHVGPVVCFEPAVGFVERSLALALFVQSPGNAGGNCVGIHTISTYHHITEIIEYRDRRY